MFMEYRAVNQITWLKAMHSINKGRRIFYWIIFKIGKKHKKLQQIFFYKIQFLVGHRFVLTSDIMNHNITNFMLLLFYMVFIFTGGQYLIVGGSVLTEVVELVKTNSTPSFGQLPSLRYNAVGAMFGNAPILCGGRDGSSYLDTCISYQNSQWSQSHSMNEKQSYPAGVQINSTTFWILGGYNNGSSLLDSTEFIIKGQTNGVPGPKITYGLIEMCSDYRTISHVLVFLLKNAMLSR